MPVAEKTNPRVNREARFIWQVNGTGSIMANDSFPDVHITPYGDILHATPAFLSIIVWGVFSALYFSRVSAIFFTFLIDKYLRLSKNGIHFRIGSISVSGFLAGKIMFRNVIYDNGDMTIKINDGHIIFRFWKPVENRKKRASRLYLLLNGMHVNVYNNLGKYMEIARIRRFDWFFENNNMGDTKKTKPPDTSPPSSVWENLWNLVGVMNVDVSSGCFLVGNKFFPYAMWTRFENLNSKIGVSESENDRALLTFEGETENVSISLIKNEQYKFTDKDKEPPRTTGNDGFPILQTASLEFLYKQDLLGYVTDDTPQSITSKVPIWSSEWTFGNNTVLSYGPWAELHRAQIYSFFFPADYQNAPVTILPTRGQKRIHIKHDVKITLTKETCMDIWFMRGGQLESIRARCGPQSSLNMSILWITTEKGFYWNLQTEFVSFQVTTSLLFTKLIECSKFNVNGSFIYPLTWNGEQNWTLEYIFTKASAWFVWDHKRLFTDLVNEWMGDEPSDITKFVPFRVHNKLRVLESFEVMMLLNECNWIDPADKNEENVEIAIVGEKLSFDCELPFIDFLPQIQKMIFSLKGERNVALRAKYPPDSATSPIRATLFRMARCSPNANPSKMGYYSVDKDDWFEMWRTELVEMKFGFEYHPVVLRNHIPSSIPFSVISDYLPEPVTHPWSLETDRLTCDILIEGSDVKFTGLIIKLLFELKNNYFGWYDTMTSIEKTKEDATKIKSVFDRVPSNAPVEMYRPMDVDVTVKVCNIRAEMLIYSPAIDSNEEAEKCPIVLVEEVVVEVKKTKSQALIQVGTSPACAFLDKSSIGSTAGCITLSGFQFRGHALYSEKDVAWDMGLLEYGWIMEILIGEINGTLDFPSHALVLHQIVESLLMFVLSPDDVLKVPENMQFCQHGQITSACSISGKKKGMEKATCRTEEKLKYRQIRISIDSINLSFCEDKTILNICADPLRVTVCNAHEGRFTEHVCIRVPGVFCKQAIRVGENLENQWIEGASFQIEGVSLDIELPNDKHEQDLEKDRLVFVKKHDSDRKRLYFLWADHSVWGCACYGNTVFFGEVDRIGSVFMEPSKRKLFIPDIEKENGAQPAVLQSVLDRNRSMLTGEQHTYYRNQRNYQHSNTHRKASIDTESFHSAKSRQTPRIRLLQSVEMSQHYLEYCNNLTVIRPDICEIPCFGEPGAISEWCKRHPPIEFFTNTDKRGVNDVRFAQKRKSTGPQVLSSALDKKELAEQDLEDTNLKDRKDFKRKLAISGCVASEIDVFLSPIGMEGLERMSMSISHSITAINPALLVHMCYRDCVLRKHRQPLTNSIFPNEAEVPPECQIMVQLPRITCGLFQCGIKKNVVKSSTDYVTANIALFLIDRAYIQSKIMNDKTHLASDNLNATSVIYQLSCNVMTAQLLQLTDKNAADFGSSGNTTTSNNWEMCAISKRMTLLEPRVMLDLNIDESAIILERKPIITFVPIRAKSVSGVHSPIGQNISQPNQNRTSPAAPLITPIGELPKRQQKILHEHYLKASVGSINTSIVMARPQEMTAGNEFPIYEALSPVIVVWLGVLDNFVDTTKKTIHQYECWKMVAMSKVLKLAFDCVDERVIVRVGKNRMSCVRVLASHQASCPSCLLLHTLFRWFSYGDDAKKIVERRLDIRDEFEMETTRKTALMALLSHWQSDIGKELKLVSNEEANKFKVNQHDEVGINILTKLSKRERRKNASEKKETRIVVNNQESESKNEKEKSKNSKIKLSSSPLLRKLRIRAGNDEDEDLDSSIPLQFGDIEMQKFTSIYDEDEIEEEEEEDELKEDNDNDKNAHENVDLYTWMRKAQKESAIRHRKTAGLEKMANSQDGISHETKEKIFINPMDIKQKAFFYTFYRWGKLQWTTLDDIEADHFHIEYSILLREVDVRMMAKSVKSSTDQQRQYITPAQQKVMNLRNAAVSGAMIWQMERDERKRTPMGGQWNISYNGNIESIRFLIGMATVSLGKELSLILKAGIDVKNELLSRSEQEKTPNREFRRWAENTQHEQITQWDEKILDMTRDYDKHMQRMKSTKTEHNEKVKLFINGSVSVSSVVLESVLNDLYVSAMILKIEVLHSKKPLPEMLSTQGVLVTTIDERDRKTATLSKKSISGNNQKIDDISVSLAKMSLTLSESGILNKKSDILRCTLNSSCLAFFTKVIQKEGKSSKSNITTTNGLGTWATLKLGALEGNMPMAAHSLHDVVMRHGKELEEQFNRLSAQPARSPMEQKIDKPSSSSASVPSSPAPVTTINNGTKVAPRNFQNTTFISHNTLNNYDGRQNQASQIMKRQPIAVVNFILEIAGIEMNIQLLPSLHAKYRIYRASSNGITGDKAKWTISVDEHYFEFCVTGQGGKTETFRLQLPSVKCTGHYSVEQGTSQQHKPSTDKKLVYREGGSLQMTVLLGSVNHVFTTELLNQLMFAEHSFRTELTSLINRIRSSSASSSSNSTSANSNQKVEIVEVKTTNNHEKPPLLFAIKVLTKDPKTITTPVVKQVPEKAIPWLQLTAATPTQTAVRLTIDSLEGELTNKWVVKEEGSKERIYGSAVIHFNAKLGQLVKAAQYDEVVAELQEYATFMTQVRVENKERNMLNSSYSYHISLNRPILLVKAAAIDKAILLWLNYKNTYDYWRNEREKVVQEKNTTQKNPMFSPTQIADIQDADMNLSLAINNGMYMCMPLYSYDVTEGMPALVLSLQKSELSVLVKRELTCKASFNGFKLSFIDDFDEQALTQSFLDAAHSEQSNCFFFPEGTYQLCSKATAIKNQPAKWVLSVSAEMQGVEIDLDQRIGKLAKLLVNTCSMIGKNDNDDESFWEDQKDLDSDDEKLEGADELKKLKAEDRVPWVENKMHEHSRAVFELAARGVSTKKLEAEKHKLRQYELIRFKAFRRNMVEKWRKGTSESSFASGSRSNRPSASEHKSREIFENPSKETPVKVVAPIIETTPSTETVNFNLDVKVNITSGTCTLRTSKKEGNVQMNFPGQIGETLKRLNQGTRDIKAMFEPPTLTTTSFSIPSVEIKAYHVSDPAESATQKFGKSLEKKNKLPTDMAKDAEKLTEDLKSKSRYGNQKETKKKKKVDERRGCFYMFIGLASMPTETVVTPHLATYLEQVLEPLPPSAVFRSENVGNSQNVSTVVQKEDANNDVHNIVAIDTAALPIDFVLYLDVQSSTIRFDGKQQTSRNQAQADCLLTLPRLTLELTTKRSNDNADNYVGGIYISGQFKDFMLKIFNPLEPELESSRALQLSLDLLSFVISRNKNSSSEPDNRVRFVFTSQIGKASFDYNFRRLGELIQFPKPWYRAAIARRVFFGDQSAPRQKEGSDMTATTRSRFDSDKRKPALSSVSNESSSGSHQRKPWTAMVLAAIQWNEIEVNTFMSNTMGWVSWNATKGLLWGDAKLNSALERDVTVTFVLGSSELSGRDGAVGGVLKLNNLKISGAHSLSSNTKKPPVNKAKLKLDWITANIVWMSRRILIAKWTNPAFSISDYHIGIKEGMDKIVLSEVGMNVESSWDDIQMVITKTTVDDIEAVVTKIIQFFEEQLKNSRILLGNFNPNTNAKKIPNPTIETRKPATHFWEKVIDYISEMQVNEQLLPLMERDGTKVGGHVSLKANGISLVLMKGDMNADTWAVFHLRDAFISFDPIAHMDFLDHQTKQKIGILLKQTFSIQLGSKKENRTENLANVCRVQTRFNEARHLTKTDDILEYFIGDVMKTLGLHHNMQKQMKENVDEEQIGLNGGADTQSTTSIATYPSVTSFGRFRNSSPNKTKGSVNTPKSNHNVLELFQFPGLEARMTTEQLNGLDDGDHYESAFRLPLEVFTTFVTDFYSEVAIETNFNAQVSFLPELLKSYLKDTPNTQTSSSLSSPAVTCSSKESFGSDTPLKDPRVYICREWRVEPRVRFIDRIKWTPPVVDEILKKLQIFDHRNTIPKVIQRAVLDPLDATLATAVVATLEMIDNKKTIRKMRQSRKDCDNMQNENDDDKHLDQEVSVRIDLPVVRTPTSVSKESSKEPTQSKEKDDSL
ncbi:unnamed protein product [Caenorhabditis angaria]|uniref:Bridge-like lipid transfer protein family member 1 C-terminal domain-containing protein n=1 Tax=Caenorhabditis angaria TaxID=860376 RepID=A0A9P1I6T2_9PELO|nr:unnamed protein product [Caenorhabditis angaria]